MNNGEESFNSLKDAGSTVYMVSGAAGQHGGTSDVPDYYHEWTVYIKSVYGVGQFEFMNKTTMLWR